MYRAQPAWCRRDGFIGGIGTGSGRAAAKQHDAAHTTAFSPLRLATEEARAEHNGDPFSRKPGAPGSRPSLAGSSGANHPAQHRHLVGAAEPIRRRAARTSEETSGAASGPLIWRRKRRRSALSTFAASPAVSPMADKCFKSNACTVKPSRIYCLSPFPRQRQGAYDPGRREQQRTRAYSAMVNALLIADSASVTYSCVCNRRSFDIGAMRATYAPHSWKLAVIRSVAALSLIA